ncbi:MAG: flagellar biosynthesis protein FlhB [Fibrobacteria bacterium]|nr:flagellar biosynthesis protein FlhB [Fibrobacteria bacterium]
MAEQDEKTEEPTAKRQAESRKKGMVSKSADLSSALLLIIAALTLWLFSNYIGTGLQKMMRECFLSVSTLELSVQNISYFSMQFGKMFLVLLGPFFVIMYFFSYVVNVMQFGFLFTTKTMTPKLDKMFGPQAFAKLVSPEKLVDLIKSIFKMALVGTVGYNVISKYYFDYLYLVDQSVGLIVFFLCKVLLELVLKCAVLLLVIGIIDFMYQKHKNKKSIKMTKQEVKDEAKSTEGDPHIKGKIKQMRMEMHQKMMMQEVPKATVVVTNPTFIAIAIRYDQKADSSPIVVAKGKRLVAEKIKKVAKENGIPIVEDKPLARSMFDIVTVGQEIPEDFFGPIAEILAYIYNIKGSGMKHGMRDEVADAVV